MSRSLQLMSRPHVLVMYRTCAGTPEAGQALDSPSKVVLTVGLLWQLVAEAFLCQGFACSTAGMSCLWWQRGRGLTNLFQVITERLYRGGVEACFLRSHHPRELRLLCFEEAPSCSERNQHGWRLKGIARDPGLLGQTDRHTSLSEVLSLPIVNRSSGEADGWYQA